MSAQLQSVQPHPAGVALARPGDDASLRQLLRTPLPGSALLSFEREPDYFAGCSVLGDAVETPVIRSGGEVIAACCRAARSLYLGGRPARIGYLGQLRVAPEQRGRMLVARGMRFLRERHRADPLDGYLATITDGNREAVGVLVRRSRPGFPAFEPITTLHTLALPARRVRPSGQIGGAEIRPADPGDLPAVGDFLNVCGSRRQLFPVVPAGFLCSERTRGLRPRDLLLAFDGNEIVGVLALWDQSGYKQTVVHRYPGALGRLRPLYDLSLRLRGALPLPAPGDRLRHASAAFVCLHDDRPEIFAALLAAALSEARRRGLHRLMLGLCHEDPLRTVARRFAHLNYRSTLYGISFEGRAAAQAFVRRLEGIRHVEIATL